MRKTVRIDDLTHGVDLGVPASSLKGPEMPWALNFKPHAEQRIKSRGGMRHLRVPSVALEEFYPTQRAGQWTGLGFTASSVARYDLAYNETVINAALTPGGTETAWSVAGWPTGVVFGARIGGPLKAVYLDPDLGTGAGLEAPTFVAVAAAGAAGVLTAADYEYVFQYRDSRTGSKSSYGPASNRLALGANLQINLSGLVASADPKVTNIDIFRIFPNGVGAYYFVGSVANGITVFTDNVAVKDQGEQASQTNGLPPAGVVGVAAWRGRLWVTDGRLVYPSKLLNPQAFNPLDSIQAGDTLNDPIMGLAEADTALIVLKRHSMWYITGTGATSWEVNPFDEKHGIVGHRAFAFFGKTLFWISDDALYRAEGLSEGVEVGSSGRRLRPVFDSLNLGAGVEFLAVSHIRGQGLLFQLSSVYGSLDHLLFFYHMPTDSLWPWKITDTNAFNNQQTVTFFHAGAGPIGEPTLWLTTNRPGLSVLDEVKQFKDEVFNVSSGAVEKFTPRYELSPRYFDFEGKKGLIAQVNAKWRGEPIESLERGSTEPDPSTELFGYVNFEVYRERRAEMFASPETPPVVQPTKTVFITPLVPPFIVAGVPTTTVAQGEEWHRFALKTRDAVPVSTIGLKIRFQDFTGAGLFPISRPISIGAVEMELDLIETARLIK